MTVPHPLIDGHGRVLQDLRVSVTDRCNFRCLYCLPETEEAANFYQNRFQLLGRPSPIQPTPILRAWKPHHEILRFEEIERLVRLLASLGIRKVRLTGGEPLLRADLPDLVARLAPIPGVDDLAMTTNGFLFATFAARLREAGLRRISFSLDSLDPATFLKMTGRPGCRQVLDAIRLARDLGFAPIKVNAVVIRDLNDHEIGDLAEFARRERVALRFIEFMPLDSGRTWQREFVIPARDILARLQQRFDLVHTPSSNPSETARRWRFADLPPDHPAEIGLIAPVSEPFCGHCNRLRLTADGQIRTCLFSIVEHNLKTLLRSGADDDALARWLRQVVLGKEDRHHIGEPGFAQPERSMSCIGG